MKTYTVAELEAMRGAADTDHWRADTKLARLIRYGPGMQSRHIRKIYRQSEHHQKRIAGVAKRLSKLLNEEFPGHVY